MLTKFCLYCHEEIENTISWSSFFEEKEETSLCRKCEEQLEEIAGPTCHGCGRPLEKLAAQYIIGDRCLDCVRWEEDSEWSGFLSKNESIYLYNDFLKEMISQYKFRGDYLLANAFAFRMKEKLRGAKFDYLVPIPLSKERQFERGFNQSEALIVEAGLKATSLLQRTHSEKQSKKSRAERIHVPQVFRLDGQVDIQNKTIILIDDIYTTGSTLRHAAKILIQSGARCVSSLTLARG